MGMGMNVFYGDGYEIVKPVPGPPPSLVSTPENLKNNTKQKKT